MTVRPSDLLPSRDWYVAGCWPGTEVWRHARTPLTPAWPAWVGEGSPCTDEGCHGRRVPYKTSQTDTGLDTLDEYGETSTVPTEDSVAGWWVCSVCYEQGTISLGEVRQHRNDVPQGSGRHRVLPLFGPRALDEYTHPGPPHPEPPQPGHDDER